MAKENPRAFLARIVRERGDDYANLSRLIGRNAAYIQQFIARGTPRRLDERDRGKLAKYFAIDERLLGGPDILPLRTPMIAVPRLAVGASAGPGALVGQEGEEGHFAFDERWLRKMAPSGSSNLSMIQVSGDSMAPTLADGDDILVDRGDAAERLRDGIYVLRREENLSVKRLALNPAGRRVSIKSDNTAYRDFSDVRLDSVDVIGRVVWAGRRVA